MDERRLQSMPESGRVIVAHPSLEAYARSGAERRDLPYFLTPIAPTDCLHEFDVENLKVPWKEWITTKTPDDAFEVGSYA